MNELIPIHDNNGKKAVSARELHAYLESKKDFSNWIKQRIEKYDLIENIDFTVFTQKGENLNGGRPTIEYALTIDAAKELSMVEGNAKGKQARKYFIAVEKEYREGKRVLSPAEALLKQIELMVAHEKEISALKQRTEAIEGKVNGLLELKANTEAELKSIPVSTETLPEMELRDKVRLLVNRYCQACGVLQQAVWDNIYQTLYYTYHIPIKSYTKVRKDESWLDVADRKGHVDKIYIIISNMLKSKGLSTT